MRYSVLTFLLISCCAMNAMAHGSDMYDQTPSYTDTTLIKDSVNITSNSIKKLNKKPAARSRMSQSTRNRIAKIEALGKKIDKIEANIKRREAEIAKVEARQ